MSKPVYSFEVYFEKSARFIGLDEFFAAIRAFCQPYLDRNYNILLPGKKIKIVKGSDLDIEVDVSFAGGCGSGILIRVILVREETDEELAEMKRKAEKARARAKALREKKKAEKAARDADPDWAQFQRLSKKFRTAK